MELKQPMNMIVAANEHKTRCFSQLAKLVKKHSHILDSLDKGSQPTDRFQHQFNEILKNVTDSQK